MRKYDFFIQGVIEKCREKYRTTWELTDIAYASLALSVGQNPGLAKYALYLFDPEPGQVIDDTDLLRRFQGRRFNTRNRNYEEWLSRGEDNEVFKR